ncbi:hypothetical protein LCGC14_2325820, partial [marine sediment metagenome]
STTTRGRGRDRKHPSPPRQLESAGRPKRSLGAGPGHWLGLSSNSTAFSAATGPHLCRHGCAGGTPTSKVDIDHNLAYLKETRLVPNYDVSMKIPEAIIANQYASWNTKPKDLYPTLLISSDRLHIAKAAEAL